MNKNHSYKSCIYHFVNTYNTRQKYCANKCIRGEGCMYNDRNNGIQKSNEVTNKFFLSDV